MSHGGSVDSLHPKGRKRGCSAHIRGHCDYGSKCIYSHDADAVVVCKHHPRCVRGQLCPFLHSAEAAEERQTRGRCFAEIRRGSCDKPSTCSYQHKCQNYSTCTLPQCPHAHEDDESAPKPPTVVSASWGDGSEFGCDRKGRKICANFKLGTCAYGKGCKLSHDDDDLICKHYPDCSRGDNCPFLHTKINPPKPPNKICFNYLRGRLCDTSTCTYLHDTVDATGKPLVIPPCSYPDCSNPRCRFLHATPERGQSRLAGAGLFRHADAQPDADYPPSLPMMDEMAGWTQHDEGPPEMPDLPDEPSAPVWTLATARPLMERLSAVRRMVDALKRQEVARVSAIRAGLQALSNKLESTSELVGDISSTLLQSQEVIDVCTSTLAAVANHKHRQRQRKLRGRRWRPVVRRRACDSDMSVSISDDTPAAKRPRRLRGRCYNRDGREARGVMGGPSHNYVGPGLGSSKPPKHGYGRNAGGPSQRYPDYQPPKQYMSPYGPPAGGGGDGNDGPWSYAPGGPRVVPQPQVPPEAPPAVAVPRGAEEPVPDVEETVKGLEESVRLLIDGQADDVLQVQEQINAVGREVRAISAEVRSLTGAQAETQQKMDDLRQLLATTLEELRAAGEADDESDDDDDSGGDRRQRRSYTDSESPRRGGSQEKPPSNLSCDTTSADLVENSPLPLASATAGNAAGEEAGEGGTPEDGSQS